MMSAEATFHSMEAANKFLEAIKESVEPGSIEVLVKFTAKEPRDEGLLVGRAIASGAVMVSKV